MADDLIAATGTVLETGNGARNVPTLVVEAGGDAQKRFIEFFAAQIRNRNTREAYIRDVVDFFDWAEDVEIDGLLDIEPIHVAAWVELETRSFELQTVKQPLAALRHLFDWLVTSHVLHTNPASFVRGNKFSYSKGKPPILTPNEAQKLIRSIPTDTVTGLRDRALIRLMIYTFARVSAAVHRQRAWAMVKHGAQQAGVATHGIFNHTFRGTGITAYLENHEAKLENAQQMAAHSDPKMTRLYDRRNDEVTMDKVERIGI